jgi:hypothetical protein
MRLRKTKKKKVVEGGLMALDLRNPRSFEGISDPRHAVGRTSRSVSEAFKDADYATALWKCESDFWYGVRFLKQMVEGMFVVFMMLFIPVLVLTWLFK